MSPWSLALPSPLSTTESRASSWSRFSEKWLPARTGTWSWSSTLSCLATRTWLLLLPLLRLHLLLHRNDLLSGHQQIWLPNHFSSSHLRRQSSRSSWQKLSWKPSLVASERQQAGRRLACRLEQDPRASSFGRQFLFSQVVAP